MVAKHRALERDSTFGAQLRFCRERLCDHSHFLASCFWLSSSVNQYLPHRGSVRFRELGNRKNIEQCQAHGKYCNCRAEALIGELVVLWVAGTW